VYKAPLEVIQTEPAAALLKHSAFASIGESHSGSGFLSKEQSEISVPETEQV